MRNDGALAPARKSAPQEVRTFFVSSCSAGHRHIFQSERMGDLFIAILSDQRAKGRVQIHEFVLMSDHFHMLLTPAPEHSLEKCIQFIKGGFSFRAKKESGFNGEIWQSGYNEQRIKDAAEYRDVAAYIRENPVKAGKAQRAQDHRYSSASGIIEMDPIPSHFRG